MSHYYYVLQEPRHYLHGDIAGGRMSLAEYVASGITTEVDNGQTRLLAGEELSQQPHGESATPFGRCDRGMLDLAKARLAHNFAVVGVSERFDEAVVLMQRALGWRAPFYLPLNITHQRPTIDDIPTASVEAIRGDVPLTVEI